MTRTEGGVTTRAAQLTASAAKNTEIKNAAISLFSELTMRLGLERVRERRDSRRSRPPTRRSSCAPPAGTTLPWDDTVDVLLGRVAREALGADRDADAGREAYGCRRPDGRTPSSRSTTR